MNPPQLLTDLFTMNYSIISTLGEGGYGSVYLVEDDMNCQYAAKMIPDNKAKAKTFCTMRGCEVPNEVALWQGLQHPNLLSLYDVFHENKQWVLVMEYSEGYMDLYDFIDYHGKLSTSEAAHIISQLLDVTLYLTIAGVDHRDIKDENILYNPDTKQIKLIDFGSASPLTKERYTYFKGTEVYIPPEWFTKSSYSPLPATVWSIGCLVYILLNAERPFRDAKETVTKDIEWLEEVDGVSKDFIQQCLKKDESERISLSDMMYHPFLFDWASFN